MAIRRLAKCLETDKALAREVKRVEIMLFAKAWPLSHPPSNLGRFLVHVCS
jgi:hypothetical protein